MKPIPVAFHIGPLTLHTYGIGLAITFWFALRYFERRLRDNGYSWEWLNNAFLWIIGASILGARAVHVAAHIHYYSADPSAIPAVWQGGLSSYGGLLGGLPTGLWLARKHCPELGFWRALDLVSPVLMAAWAVGRLLGPQLMVGGGGHPTSSWVGMYYAGEVGKRLPVPIFQAIESFAVFLILLAVEKWQRTHGGPTGLVVAVMAVAWDIARFFDEYLWLATPRLWNPVEVAALGLIGIGSIAIVVLLARARSGGAADGPGPAPSDRGAISTTG